MSANMGYPRASIFDYIQWLLLYPLFTESGLRKRAARLPNGEYSRFLIEIADARRDKGLSGVNAMKIVHETQRRLGAR